MIDAVVDSRLSGRWVPMGERRREILAVLRDSKFNYLLRPEVDELLPTIEDATTHLAAYTLWVTGAGVSEMLQLRPQDCSFDQCQVDLKIRTLKNRAPKGGNQSWRTVPVFDTLYIETLRRYIRTMRIAKREPIFALSRSAIRQRLLVAGERLSPPLPFPVNPLTLRNSFAVDALQRGATVDQVQKRLGFKDRRSMDVYRKIVPD